MSAIQITEPALLIRISKLFKKGMTAEQMFEATRGVWKIGVDRDSAKYALSIAAGQVREVYEIGAWQPAGTATYNTRPKADVTIPDRWEFTGKIAPAEIRDKYIGQSVKHYFLQGNSNPVNYVNVKVG